MRILLLGRTGQLGWEMERSLASLVQVNALDHPQIDLCDPDTYVPILRDFKPELVVNATAYTAVDTAETEVDLAMAINAVSPGVLAEQAKKINAAGVGRASQREGAARTKGLDPLSEGCNGG